MKTEAQRSSKLPWVSCAAWHNLLRITEALSKYTLAVMEHLRHTSSCSRCSEYTDERDPLGHCPWLSPGRGGGGSSDRYRSYYNAGLNESVIKRHPVLGGGSMPHLEDGSGKASCRRWHVRWVLKNGEGISRSVGRDPDRSCGGENQQASRSPGKRDWGGRQGQHMEPPPTSSLPQPWAVCQEDAANLASRAWAILNEQREPAVQMDEA